MPSLQHSKRRAADRNDSVEFELRQHLNVLTLDVWSLRRLSGENPPPALARIIARQEKQIGRMAALAGLPQARRLK